MSTDDIGDGGPVELFIFLAHYFCSFGLCILFTGLIWIFLVFRNRRGKRHSTKHLTALLLLVPLAIFGFYFILTAKEVFSITSLDSENNLYAAVIYKKLFNVSLNEAVKIATDKGQSGNVRFYASCRIADLLPTNDPTTKEATLSQVAGSPSFHTGFGGTNDLTCGFSNIAVQEGPFTVTEIINRRLEIDLFQEHKGVAH